MKSDIGKIADQIVDLVKQHYEDHSIASDWLYFEIPSDGFMYTGECSMNCRDQLGCRCGCQYSPPEVYGYSEIRLTLDSFGACDAEGVDIPCAMTAADIQSHLNKVKLRYEF